MWRENINIINFSYSTFVIFHKFSARNIFAYAYHASDINQWNPLFFYCCKARKIFLYYFLLLFSLSCLFFYKKEENSSKGNTHIFPLSSYSSCSCVLLPPCSSKIHNIVAVYGFLIFLTFWYWMKVFKIEMLRVRTVECTILVLHSRQYDSAWFHAKFMTTSNQGRNDGPLHPKK
jgi:hypothetical protein